ncbi:hypothetical protein HPB47_019235 [Ixodes persulcatus]|uniref:Uncharacterized protein n=1 Tax=Ixodes persulcatus TaxID=34615 RepID=A0AC60QJJ2_IXOPE|nr:hypothetical protein HPB47_019235 [Ixodes persulcatus]
MPTSRECLCCRECPPAVATQPEGCVTEHMDFALICLQPAVLRVAYWALDEAGLQPAPGEQTQLLLAAMLAALYTAGMHTRSQVLSPLHTAEGLEFS